MSPDRIDYLVELAGESGSTPTEGAIAAAFVRRHAADYDDFDFQKRVGHGQQLPAGSDPGAAAGWYQATRKRVDLVGYTQAGATLIECKDIVTWAALRQASEYRDLWAIIPQKPPVIAVIVAGRTIDPGITQRAADLNIQVELFPGLLA